MDVSNEKYRSTAGLIMSTPNTLFNTPYRTPASAINDGTQPGIHGQSTELNLRLKTLYSNFYGRMN